MTYTVWDRGRLLGESPLDFIRCMPKLRTGFLHATPLGERLLPVAGGTCRAANALHRAARHCNDKERMRLPEYEAFENAAKKCASFRLELRSSDGTVIPTEYVGVTDFGFIEELGDDAFDADVEDEPEDFADESLASLGLDEWDASWDPEVDELDRLWDFDEDGADEAWRAREERGCERRWSRYQVQVRLIDEESIP
jgi:hypothetical protein